MFCNKPKHSRNVPSKSNRKRKKRSRNLQCDKKAKQTDQSYMNLATAMSTWAKNYSMAETWQLKHQVAYWKARAMALEYENSILHDAIKNNYFPNQEHSTQNEASSEEDHDSDTSAESESEAEIDEAESENDDEGNDDFEVSEEFIEFLKQNAKFKEEVRQEKERLKALREAENDANLMEEMKFESSEERQNRLIELYGDNWEKIMALETYNMCNYINECDKGRPKYWPNIPFNFSG